MIALLLGVGALVFLTGAYTAVEQLGKVRLPTTRAQVAKSDVAIIEESDSSTSYKPQIDFRYTVADKPYTSTTFATANPTKYPEAKRVADVYRTGTEHAIHYNPVDPEEIYTNVGYTFEFFRQPLGCFLVAAVFIALAIGAYRLLLPTSKKPAKVKSGALVGWIFVVFGVWLILFGVWLGYSGAMASRAWQPVDAQVTDGRIHRYVSGGKTSTTYYETIVRFRYTVGGREYVSPSSDKLTSSKEAKAALTTYAPGSRHQVRYNPNDPNDIRYAGDSDSWIGCIICLILGVVVGGIGALILAMSD